MNILRLFSSGALLQMCKKLLRIKTNDFGAVVFVGGQFVCFRHTAETRISFSLAVRKAHLFLKDF